MLLATMPHTPIIWLLWTATTFAQTIYPSNRTIDLYPEATSPRFLLNGTEFSSLPAISLAPLGEYAEMSHSDFLSVKVSGHLVNVGASNANIEGSLDQFSYLSCDPSAYTGNLDANDVFHIVVDQPRANIVILYSETSDHCAASGLNNLPMINGILTTTDVMVARMVANLNLNFESNGDAVILPDRNAYTNNTNGSGFDNSNGFGQSPTTAVAMIILYSITGIITALFVVIIVTGAIRAHRHPERYGPRNIIGRGRQSRARGVARAMLDTLPIVKFGDREANTPEQQKPPTENRDVEMNPSTSQQPGNDTPDSKTGPAPTAALSLENTDQASTSSSPPAAPLNATNADGTDDLGHLGCSICTEDFTKGEEVRVLPCNHKFHPDCVDPWLLNVSGTCPLCRVDLRPQGEDDGAVNGARSGSSAEGGDGTLPPPLGGGAGAGNDTAAGGLEGSERRRRDTFANLRQMANLGVGSREERMEALRRLRTERRARQEQHTRVGRNEPRSSQGEQQRRESRSNTASEEEERERRGRSRRFRELFRIRTERNEEGRSDLRPGERER